MDMTLRWYGEGNDSVTLEQSSPLLLPRPQNACHKCAVSVSYRILGYNHSEYNGKRAIIPPGIVPHLHKLFSTARYTGSYNLYRGDDCRMEIIEKPYCRRSVRACAGADGASVDQCKRMA